MESISASEARRIALSAQGFTNTTKLPARRPFEAALHRLHVLQIDAINVFARSHYLPVFSRHGAYDSADLDAYLWHSGEFTEYWAHEAAFIRVEDRPLFGWRMHDFRSRHHSTGRAQQLASSIDAVRQKLAAEGPQFLRGLDEERREQRGPWWDWSDTKRAVELLFAWGEVVSVGRSNFQRRYALAEHAIGAEHLIDVDRATAQRQLISRAAQSLGVATLADLADYHRLKVSEARVATQALEDSGELIPVTVEGWLTRHGSPERAWIHREAAIPRRLAPNALLTPFDPVVWFRPRAERLFNFHYRIEIYTPKEQRRFGYYCLPLMVGGKLSGRIDLKAERAKKPGDVSALLVQAAWRESDADERAADVAQQLLAQAAAWQGLSEVRVSGAGNLALPERFDAS